jgi:phenylacetate-CoA ligase
MDEHWAIMGGQMVVPFKRNKPPYGVRNYGLNQLYLSTHHISPASVQWYADALKSFSPTHMIVYPSSASLLASYAREKNIRLPAMSVVFSNAEKLHPHQQELISEAFHCPVVDTYGMGEYTFGASECKHGNMHIWPEIGLLEVLKLEADRPAPVGDNGRFIVTGLLNADMPLIRYEVGDLGTYHGYEACACGRSLPVLGRIEGRANDLLYTPDGRGVFWLNPVFYGLAVREAQIVQESLNDIVVMYVPGPGSGTAAEIDKTISDRIRMRMGSVTVTVKPVPIIPRDKGGKFQAVVSLVRKPNSSFT